MQTKLWEEDLPIEIALPPRLAIEFALGHGNSADIWQESRRLDPHEFVEHVRDAVTFYRVDGPMTRYGRVIWHGALVLVPVLVPESMAKIINENNHPQVLEALRNARWALQQWCGERYQFEMMSALMGYNYVSQWDPVVMFNMLQGMVERKKSDEQLLPNALDLQMPGGASVLAFMVGAAKRVGQWPEIPQASYERDSPLRNRMAGMLDMAGSGCTVHGVQVLRPAFACNAILDGLLAWIDNIHVAEQIVNWDIQPWKEDSSLLQLATDHIDGWIYSLPLRQYQLGTIGMKTVFERVDALSQGRLELIPPSNP